jgi:hypothetical protein
MRPASATTKEIEMAFTNEIRTEIEIDATAQEVWDVLVDFPRHPEWNPGMEKIEGTPAPGERLAVTFSMASGRTIVMKPHVLAAEPGSELRWLGRMFVPMVFDGEHRFEIHERAPGRVTFVQGERFRGLLVPFLRKLIEVDTVENFHRTNDALAARVASLRATP